MGSRVWQFGQYVPSLPVTFCRIFVSIQYLSLISVHFTYQGLDRVLFTIHKTAIRRTALPPSFPLKGPETFSVT